jgi:hypothetical protein
LTFHGNSGEANAPQCHVIRTLPVLFSIAFGPNDCRSEKYSIHFAGDAVKTACSCPCKVFVKYQLGESKSNPITGLDRPLGFQKVEAPRYLDNRHMKVVRLSALRTGRLFCFLLEAESTPGP